MAFLERGFISALFASCWAEAFAGRWEGGNKAINPWQSVSRVGFAGGAEEGTCHPSLPRSALQVQLPGCESLEVPCVCPQPRVFISWGPAAFGDGSDRSFCFPGRDFGLRAAGRAGGERGKARSGLRRHSRAPVINRNLFTRITTAGHGALGPLVQLLGATDSSTGEPTERTPWTPSPRVLLLFWFLS